ncbi:methyl-accepting chemotaxis protein, partial [Natrarchaeobius halalkaliphilus]
DATDEQARASGRVVTMVDEATEISEETNAETETVAAAAEEQTATVSEVATGAQSLTEMADDLRNSLDAFDVTEEMHASDDTWSADREATDDLGVSESLNEFEEAEPTDSSAGDRPSESAKSADDISSEAEEDASSDERDTDGPDIVLKHDETDLETSDSAE